MTNKMEREINAICQELTGTEQDLSRRDTRSLKYYVRDIHNKLTTWMFDSEYKRDESKHNLMTALIWIGAIGVILAITRSAASDIEWVREHTLSFRFWGVTLCTIFVGVSLERSSLVKALWSFTVTKVVLSIVLSGLVIYSRGQAGIYINSVFHIDASSLPITLLFTTGLMVFNALLPFVLVTTSILLCVSLCAVVAWIRNKLAGGKAELSFFYPFMCVLVASVLLYHGWSWSGNQLSESRVPEKIYLMAHALDFNNAHECANVPADRPVVFLGNAQDAVLVAPYQLEDFDFTTFFETSVRVPESFMRVRCEYKTL